MNLLARLFAKPADPRERLLPLWNAVVGLAREPHWYADGGVADAVPGRFDMVSAVLSLVLVRMERDGALVGDTAPLTELFVDDMDAQVRELGVGDIVVGKHIGKLVGALGGRVDAYRAALALGPERMEEAVRANVTLRDGGSVTRVAEGLRALGGRLSRTDDAALLAGRIAA